MRVIVPSKRLGPNFSRPGSILLPTDRLLYQALADQAAPIIDKKTDHTRSFSHRLAPPDSAAMFLPTRNCWSALQKALAKNAESDSVRYILKIDVANFFGSLNQHTLINILNDSGYPKSLSSILEPILTSHTSERSSRGILQGIYPSDLFGNFYMAPVDRFLKESDVPSARYVTEEPDLEELFNDAVVEIADQVDDDDFDADYGFQSEWEDDEDDEDEEDEEEALELKATKILFDSISNYPGHEESIERFCLPMFAKAGSDYAVKHVTDAFKKRPAMSQIYAAYLAKFLQEEGVQGPLLELAKDSSITDWQKMWVLAALMQVAPINDAPVKAAQDLLKDANRHEALRGVAAVYIGRYGDMIRRKTLIGIYPSVSSYIQTAIYFSSRAWPGPERANAKALWGGHGYLNQLLTIAMAKK